MGCGNKMDWMGKWMEVRRRREGQGARIGQPCMPTAVKRLAVRRVKTCPFKQRGNVDKKQHLEVLSSQASTPSYDGIQADIPEGMPSPRQCRRQP